ncbi:class I alpha-mannosidase [Eremomyces bilateralis CBS 781.70]|uniref:alpha-1,2-Mannosidase n=1 Tax=Eremomyces bilateralis CBS 781.70 TaxID=1392243 RepID=A0A6G1G3N0_9PEZI|nr:class I alpha-mannosidase [Eremomyces bilateralis CBS 781.70]KAF1812520.1 class I alpha-mannosidase [Eremomyces bilateralis CBS 781.70]
MLPFGRRRAAVFFIVVSGLLIFSQLVRLDQWDLSSSLWQTEPQAPERAEPRIHFQTFPEVYPVSSLIQLPTSTPSPIPKIQHDFEPETASQSKERLKRLGAVKKAFLHSWKGYKAHAWLQDEVGPLSGEYKNDFGGWGATLVDSLDTLYIMGLHEEFVRSLRALITIDFSASNLATLNVFETTIRYLGGLLSAYDLSGGQYSLLLDKARQLGDILYGAFDTPNRMPLARWDWAAGQRYHGQTAQSHILAAELGSLSLEFTRLSQLTGEPKYYDAVQRITDALAEQQNDTHIPGLWPVALNAKKLRFTEDRSFTLGGMADSLYEYLPKEHLLLGGTTQQYAQMYEFAIEAAKEHLFFRPLTPGNQDILISGSVRKSSFGALKQDPQGQHLTCFVGGMVALGAKIFSRPEELTTARQLVDGCIWAYESMPSGIMPETFRVMPCKDPHDCEWSREAWLKGIFDMNHKAAGPKDDENKVAFAENWVVQAKLSQGFTEVMDKRYILRPEAIESIFILYRITGDRRLQDKAWQMFQAIEKAARTPISYAAIADVTVNDPERLDTCESFWTAETLKYFFLIFSEPSIVSLDEFVFNTEAHPFRRPA